ncbi:uncharacterized protein LOC143040592 [Oratosquilla oratoria]|uniref:uncharacterized protein LOC143040592 n=1 Tax=Oratosquilla oratoria TaxID=337810 RepID=UPI003F7689C6
MTSPWVPARAAALWLLTLSLHVVSIASLHVEVEVPEYSERGSAAKLRCHYRLDGLTLYSLKWYKEDKQFFQYIPANSPPISVFQFQGVHVNMDVSDGYLVMIDDLQLSSSGTFRCEVITEAPHFITRFAQGNLTVIDLPDSAPVLEGARTSYRLNDRVDVNCTSPMSKPAADLEWYINGEKASQYWLRPYPVLRERGGLETSRLGLRFSTSRIHFPDGQLRLKCVAKIAIMYFQSQETSVIETSFLHQRQAEESRSPHSRFLFFGSGCGFSTSTPWMVVTTVLAVLLRPRPT